MAQSLQLGFGSLLTLMRHLMRRWLCWLLGDPFDSYYVVGSQVYRQGGKRQREFHSPGPDVRISRHHCPDDEVR